MRALTIFAAIGIGLGGVVVSEAQPPAAPSAAARPLSASARAAMRAALLAAQNRHSVRLVTDHLYRVSYGSGDGYLHILYVSADW
ncbi:MAG: hypothetical protein ACRETK_12250, partial [Steroidobacteraceae bacterium]